MARRRRRTLAIKVAFPSAVFPGASGSGPRRASTALTPSKSSSSQVVGPDRSATPCLLTSRRRTAPLGGAGCHCPGASLPWGSFKSGRGLPEPTVAATPSGWVKAARVDTVKPASALPPECPPSSLMPGRPWREPTSRSGTSNISGTTKVASPSKFQAPYRPRWVCSQVMAGESRATSAAGAKAASKCLPWA